MTEIKETPLVQKAEPWWAELVQNVSDNPAQVVWPRDPWGFTSELRKAITKVSGRDNGHTEKEEILIATMMVGLAHFKKRRDKNRRVQEQRLTKIKAAANKRVPLERFHVPTTKKEKVDV